MQNDDDGRGDGEQGAVDTLCGARRAPYPLLTLPTPQIANTPRSELLTGRSSAKTGSRPRFCTAAKHESAAFMYGLRARATSKPPYDLPLSWEAIKLSVGQCYFIVVDTSRPIIFF